MRRAGQDDALLEAMEDARGLAHAAAGEAAIEGRGGQRLAGREAIAEVEGIVTASDTNLMEGALLHGDAPASAPAQLAEVDRAVLFVGCVRTFKGEPWVGLMAGRAAAAFDDLAADVERRRLQLPFARPAAGEPMRAVVAVLAGWENSRWRWRRFRGRHLPWPGSRWWTSARARFVRCRRGRRDARRAAA